MPDQVCVRVGELSQGEHDRFRGPELWLDVLKAVEESFKVVVKPLLGFRLEPVDALLDGPWVSEDIAGDTVPAELFDELLVMGRCGLVVKLESCSLENLVGKINRSERLDDGDGLLAQSFLEQPRGQALLVVPGVGDQSRDVANVFVKPKQLTATCQWFGEKVFGRDVAGPQMYQRHRVDDDGQRVGTAFERWQFVADRVNVIDWRELSLDVVIRGQCAISSACGWDDV